MLRAFFVLLLTLLPSLAVAAPAMGDRIAVLYFENKGNPELEPLKVGLTQMLTTDLTGTHEVDIIERTRLQEILDELELGHSSLVDPESAAKVGQLLQASHLVMGTYFELGGTLRIDARMVEVSTTRIVHAKGVSGKTAQFADMEKELAGDLRTFLLARATAGKSGGGGNGATRGGGETPDPKGQVTPADTVVAHDEDRVKAALAYSEGLIFMDGKDTARARESFQKAVVADPNLDAAKTQLAALDL